MSKLTIIQLLNKIANGEEVPKEIKVNDNIYHYDETDCNEFYRYRTMTNELLTDYADLNDEVEIIEEVEILEEEKKIPEKLGYQDNADGTFYLNRKKYNSEPIKLLSKKINEIIDYLESKGE